MKFFAVISLALAATPILSSPLSIRQSTQWQSTCVGAAPTNFRAFDLGSCTAQLSFDKDRYVAYQWNFDAVYADGSRVEHKPFRNFNSFGVSDTFYPYLGNNFVTRLPGNSAFTAVHEFTNVCKSGRAPVAWIFYTTSANSACGPPSYRYNTGQIRVVGGVSRPSKVSGVSLRRINDNGDFQVDWAPTSRAAAYSVIVEYPTGSNCVGDVYRNVRGARVKQGIYTTIVPTGTRETQEPRSVIVHAVDSQGVWSFTNDVASVSAPFHASLRRDKTKSPFGARDPKQYTNREMKC